jgi:hypothetical protein
MFVIHTRNYILKCVNSSVLFTINGMCQTKHTCRSCRFGESRDWTHLGWLEVSQTRMFVIGSDKVCIINRGFKGIPKCEQVVIYHTEISSDLTSVAGLLV